MTVMTTPAPPREENLPRVTILCGFLGAGKTTLLRHLLTQADGRRWAVVVNDLASLNVDAALVRRDTAANTNAGTGASPGEVVELGNGCVCCTGRDDLGEAIARLAAEATVAEELELKRREEMELKRREEEAQRQHVSVGCAAGWLCTRADVGLRELPS
jgi:molybdopterin-guanine dinucleotide biosynthesis protein